MILYLGNYVISYSNNSIQILMIRCSQSDIHHIFVEHNIISQMEKCVY